MNKWINDCLIALVVCVVTYIVAVPLVGIAAAIVIPTEYFEWFEVKGIQWLAQPILSLFTTVPALAIPAFIISYLLIRYTSKHWFNTFILSVVCYLVHFYSHLYLTYLSYPDIFSLNGNRLFLPSLVFPITVLLAGYLANKRITKSSSKDAASGAA